MLLVSVKAYRFLSIASTISSTASSDPPNTPIVLLRPKSVVFLLMKRKSDRISTDKLARLNTVYMPASEKYLSFSIYEGVME